MAEKKSTKAKAKKPPPLPPLKVIGLEHLAGEGLGATVQAGEIPEPADPSAIPPITVLPIQIDPDSGVLSVDVERLRSEIPSDPEA